MMSAAAPVQQLLAALPGVMEPGGNQSAAAPWDAVVPANAIRCGYPLTAAVPESVRAALAWAGIPFYYPVYDHRPGAEIPVHPRCIIGSELTVTADLLTIPDPGYVLAANGVELAPLRNWVRQQWGVRIKLPPGIHLGLWTAGGVMVNPLRDVAAGFIYGPSHGQRIAVSIDPGSWKAVWW